MKPDADDLPLPESFAPSAAIDLAKARIDPRYLPLPAEPYRGIFSFRLLDWRIFLERDVETERLSNLVTMYSSVLLYGQSGAGKSSLLNAGLVPHALRQGRAPERIRVFPERGRELLIERIPLQEENEPVVGEKALPRFLPSRFTSEDTDERVALSCERFIEMLQAPADLGVPLLIFDQFEELVTLFEENPKDQACFESARAARAAIERLLSTLLIEDSLPGKNRFRLSRRLSGALAPAVFAHPKSDGSRSQPRAPASARGEEDRPRAVRPLRRWRARFAGALPR